jgi:hypothetical protein
LFVDDALCEVTEPDIPQTLIDRLAEERWVCLMFTVYKPW